MRTVIGITVPTMLVTRFVALLAIAMGVGSVLPPAADARDLKSYAIVQEDATLRIEGRNVRLFGIHIPPTERDCRTTIRPVQCASQAVHALNFRIQGFVTCKDKGRDAEGRMIGLCYAGRSTFDEGQDLSVYLIRQGWALALPGAPFEYEAAERIARNAGRGVWGFRVKDIR